MKMWRHFSSAFFAAYFGCCCLLLCCCCCCCCFVAFLILLLVKIFAGLFCLPLSSADVASQHFSTVLCFLFRGQFLILIWFPFMSSPQQQQQRQQTRENKTVASRERWNERNVMRNWVHHHQIAAAAEAARWLFSVSSLSRNLKIIFNSNSNNNNLKNNSNNISNTTATTTFAIEIEIETKRNATRQH